MKVNLITDAPKPNLALMKISAWHKTQGDTVELNFPLLTADMTYASLLFSYSDLPYADIIGGPRFPASRLDPAIEEIKPDYNLYRGMDYSLGYTYRACPRTCEFCVVPRQGNPETHHSIWEFHDSNFKKICLLNNNTLADIQWRNTLEEIIDADLMLRLESGVDARLVTEESAYYLSRIKLDGGLYVAWDFPEHEEDVLRGICHLKNAGIRDIRCFVLIGKSTPAEDLDRVLTLFSMRVDPFAMPLNKYDDYQKNFARWVNHKAIFKSVKWADYLAGRPK